MAVSPNAVAEEARTLARADARPTSTTGRVLGLRRRGSGGAGAVMPRHGWSARPRAASPRRLSDWPRPRPATAPRRRG